MRYYEVFIADSRYKGSTPLTYGSNDPLPISAVVTVPMRNRLVTGFVTAESSEHPKFSTKEVKAVLSEKPLPSHCLELARWMQNYYVTNLGDSLRQFAPSRTAIRKIKTEEATAAQTAELQLDLTTPLTKDQQRSLKEIRNHPSTTVLLHGDTGTGKTRVYMELAAETIKKGKSVILLTPEIALTSQLALAAKQHLHSPTFILHSQLSAANRKKIWVKILESTEPVTVIGPRSALFSPIQNPGLIIVDEAHEPAYKQEQTPRYHASRIASQMGLLTGAQVVLGTATPLITDYYLAEAKRAVVRMTQRAVGSIYGKADVEVVDLKKREDFTTSPYLSNTLIDSIKSALATRKQAILYLNRRGSARLILCNNCGWQLLCPNCDIPLVYHADSHLARCHICGHGETPPTNCPQCKNPDIIYKSIGTKYLYDTVSRLFPNARLQRFDSDSLPGEQVNEIYPQLLAGKIDILIGTQLLAKGLDLPNLGLVGIISAETSLALPDFTAEERSFELLYQVMGRVGRGHGEGKVIIQSYNPESKLLQAAVKKDYKAFYKNVIKERQDYRFPPFSYLLKLVCRRITIKGLEEATKRVRSQLLAQRLPVEISGPTPAFYARRGRNHYWQIVVKSKNRDHLVELAKLVPSDWTIDLDPADLL